MRSDDYDDDPHLRLEHFLGEPITVLAGYLALLRDGDVDWAEAKPAMTQAVLRLNRELLANARKENQ